MQNEIIKKINQQIKKLETSLVNQSEEITFFKELLDNLDLTDFENYDQINLKNFLLAYVKSYNTSYTFEELTEIIDSIYPVLQPLTSTETQSLLETIDEVTNPDNPEIYYGIKAILTLEEDDRKNALSQLILYTSDDEMLKTGLSLLKDNKKLQDFLLLYEKDSDTWGYSLLMIGFIKKICEQKAYLLSLGYQPKNKTSLFSSKTSIQSRFNEEYDSEEIQSTCQNIYKYYERLKKSEKDRKQTTKKDIKNYNYIIEKLSHPEEEITSYHFLASKIRDDALRMDVLKYIYSHNQKYYQQLEQKYETLSKNSLLNFQELTQRYNLINIDIKEIMNNYTYQDLENTLKTLKNISITSPEILSTIIKMTTVNTVDEILKLIDQGYITIDTIKNNIDCWDKTKNYVDRIKQNIKTIEEITGNRNLYRRKNEVVLLPEDSLKENLAILKKYNLLPSITTTTNYDFLTEEELENKIDNILELGREDSLVHNLGLLNYEQKRWMRLQILEQLNIPVEDNELEGLLHTNSFFVPDEKLEDYISVSSITPKQVTIEKEDIKETPRTYIYQGIYFSKNKIKNNFMTLEQEQVVPSLTKTFLLDRKFTYSQQQILMKTYQKKK
ncbi:MAG TPA: hypothetical protein IAB35_00510 [Candidatus Faecimonas gallistercoris]|nr:hypothetical protein [Candidatus Faecimonas gallistercoris]